METVREDNYYTLALQNVSYSGGTLQTASHELFKLLFTPIYGQVITGTVIDSSNSEPLEYVYIGVIGTPIGTITDKNGIFKIDITGQPLNSIIRISMISYKPQTFTIEELRNKEINMSLERRSQEPKCFDNFFGLLQLREINKLSLYTHLDICPINRRLNHNKRE